MSRRESGSYSLMHFALAGAAFLTLMQLVLMSGALDGMTLFAPDLATQLGISSALAIKLMDALGSWYFAILIAAATGGWGAGLVAIAKSLAARYGKKYAAAW